jgi:hypothetical protein
VCLLDCKNTLDLLNILINESITDVSVDYDEERDEYDDDSDLKKYNAKITKSNMYLESKIYVINIEKL